MINLELNISNSESDNIFILYGIKKFLDSRKMTNFFRINPKDSVPSDIMFPFNITYTEKGYTKNNIGTLFNDIIFPLLKQNVFVLGDYLSGVMTITDILTKQQFVNYRIKRLAAAYEDWPKDFYSNYKLDSDYFKNLSPETVDEIKNLDFNYSSYINLLNWNFRIDNNIDDIVTNIEKCKFVIVVSDPFLSSYKFINKMNIEEREKCGIETSEKIADYLISSFQKYKRLLDNHSDKCIFVKRENFGKQELYEDLKKFLNLIEIEYDPYFKNFHDGDELDQSIPPEDEQILRLRFKPHKDLFAFFGYTI